MQVPLFKFLDISPFPIMVINQQNIIVKVNPQLVKFLNISKQQLLKREIFDIFEPTNLKDDVDWFNLSYNTGITAKVKLSANVDTVLLIPSEQDMDNLSCIYVANNTHQPLQDKFDMLFNDLNQTNSVIESANIGIWRYNLDNNEVYFSQTFKQLIHLNNANNTSESKGDWQAFKSLMFAEDRAIFDVMFKTHLNCHTSLYFQFRVIINGNTHWFQIKGDLFVENQQTNNITGTLIECTKEKRTLTELNNAIVSKNIAMDVGKIGTWHAELDAQKKWQWSWDELTNTMFELNPEDIGKTDILLATLHPKDIDMVKNTLKNSLKTGKSFILQYRIILPDGSIRHFVGKGKVGRNMKGECDRIDGICLDQTAMHNIQNELKQLNTQLEARVEQRTEELKQSTEQAEKASKIKSDFLSMMSHELRTPMNAVIGSLDLLATTEQTFESKDLIDTAKTSAENLVFILNDILDINKIEAGKLLLEDRAFSISEVIDNVIKVFIPTAIKKNINLDIYEDPNIPMFVKGDEMRIRQILFNLVGNALKFTKSDQHKKGFVTLDARIIEINEYVSTINFKIVDNGIGMDKPTQQKLFMPFMQAERSTTRNYGGTGLGLAICAKLTEMMGGIIKLTSEKGQGSCFDVELPFWLSQETAALDVESLSAAKVTLVSFASQQQEKMAAYEKFLTADGANVTIHHCPNDDSKVYDFDVMLLLLNDDVSSQDIVKNLLKNFTNTHNIYIGVPAEYLEKVRKNFKGIRVVNSQPMTRIQLIDTIKKAKENNCGLELDDLKLELDELELDELDFGDLNNLSELTPQNIKTNADILVVEDNPLNQKLIKKQLTKLGYQCDLADDGEQGKQRWQDGNYKLILTDCHMPKVDGYQMSQQIRELEKQQQASPIPIVAVTGAAMTGDAEHCYDAGMSAFVSKPVQLADLKKVLKKWYVHE